MKKVQGSIPWDLQVGQKKNACLKLCSVMPDTTNNTEPNRPLVRLGTKQLPVLQFGPQRGFDKSILPRVPFSDSSGNQGMLDPQISAIVDVLSLFKHAKISEINGFKHLHAGTL